MGGPTEGRYLIQFVARTGPPLYVGVNDGAPPGTPVIVGGSNNVWTVHKQDGLYTLVIEGSGPPVFIRDNAGKVVGDELPPASPWSIEGPDGGAYQITTPGGQPKGWTLENRVPGAPVTLADISTTPEISLLWSFIPV